MALLVSICHWSKFNYWLSSRETRIFYKYVRKLVGRKPPLFAFKLASSPFVCQRRPLTLRRSWVAENIWMVRGELAAMNIIAFCAVMAPTGLSAAPPVCELHLLKAGCGVCASRRRKQTQRTSEYADWGVLVPLHCVDVAALKILIRVVLGWVVVGGGGGALVHASGACVHCLLMTTMIYLISITACINIYIHTAQSRPGSAGHCAHRRQSLMLLWLMFIIKILCRTNLICSHAIEAALGVLTCFNGN